MATIDPVYSKLEHEKHSSDLVVITWATVTNADTCAAAAAGNFADRSVQFTGTFNSATAKLQGSNDGTNFEDLTDPQGNAISKTAAALEAVMEPTAYIKPVFSGGGASQSITVKVVGRRVAR